MARKRIKASTPDSKVESRSGANMTAEEAEQQVKAIIEKGKQKGFLTYEEMNDGLPEDAVTPARLDKLLSTLDEMGVKLLDESDVKKQTEEDFETALGKEVIPDKGHLEEDELLEKQLAGAEAARRIDDPIRMYLTQMGEIPLLSRGDEISLARKI